MAVKMPEVKTCTVGECSYNANSKCHAIAITVGHSSHACCDTFFKTSHKGGLKSVNGGVGACRQENCRFNKDLECSATAIMVGLPEGHADCMTFQAR